MSTKTISIIYLAMQTPALKSEVQMLWNYFNYKREFKELSAQRLYTMYKLYSDVWNKFQWGRIFFNQI